MSTTIKSQLTKRRVEILMAEAGYAPEEITAATSLEVRCAGRIRRWAYYTDHGTITSVERFRPGFIITYKEMEAQQS